MSKRRREEHDNSSQISERCNNSWRETHFLFNHPYILSTRFDLERKITTLCSYSDSGKNDCDITDYILSQHILSHFEKDQQGNLKLNTSYLYYVYHGNF